MRRRNMILLKSTKMPFFTNMRLVFEALPGVCASHDWLISDMDCIWPLPADGSVVAEPDQRLFRRAVLLSGTELEKIVYSRDIQFVWAVFSALPIGSKPSIPDYPYADGNPDFWRNSPKPQLPEAEFEIVCLDSSYLLLIGISKEMAEKFSESFPESIDLDDYNRRNALRPATL